MRIVDCEYQAKKMSDSSGVSQAVILNFLIGIWVFGGEEEGLIRPAFTLFIRLGVPCSLLSFSFPLGTAMTDNDEQVNVAFLEVLQD